MCTFHSPSYDGIWTRNLWLMRPEQDQLGNSNWRVLKFVRNKVCPVIFNLAVGSEFGQFGKMSNKFKYNVQ